MSTEERTVYRYGDFPELFWDVRPDAVVDGTNPAVISRLLQHAPPETIWKLVPVDVLLRDFEKLDLPEHTRRFWSLVVGMMREKRGIPTSPPNTAQAETPPPPRLPPPPAGEARQELPRYRYRDFPGLFWDLKGDLEVDRRNPAVIARVLADGSTEAIRKIVPRHVLLRDFETLELPPHARRFWSVVVTMMREQEGSAGRGHAA
jgi:hypothetical protein